VQEVSALYWYRRSYASSMKNKFSSCGERCRFSLSLLVVLTLYKPIGLCYAIRTAMRQRSHPCGCFTQSFASPIALADQVDDPLVKRRLASPKEQRLRAEGSFPPTGTLLHPRCRHIALLAES